MTRKSTALWASTALTVAIAAGGAHAQTDESSCEGILERVEALPEEALEDVDWTIEDVEQVEEAGDEEACAIIVSEFERIEEESDQAGTAEASPEETDDNAGGRSRRAVHTVTLPRRGQRVARGRRC